MIVVFAEHEHRIEPRLAWHSEAWVRLILSIFSG